MRPPKTAAHPCAVASSGQVRAALCRAVSSGDNDGGRSRKRAIVARRRGRDHAPSGSVPEWRPSSPSWQRALAPGPRESVTWSVYCRRCPVQSSSSSQHLYCGIFHRRLEVIGRIHPHYALFLRSSRGSAPSWCGRPNSSRTSATSGSSAIASRKSSAKRSTLD